MSARVTQYEGSLTQTSSRVKAESAAATAASCAKAQESTNIAQVAARCAPDSSTPKQSVVLHNFFQSLIRDRPQPRCESKPPPTGFCPCLYTLFVHETAQLPGSTSVATELERRTTTTIVTPSSSASSELPSSAEIAALTNVSLSLDTTDAEASHDDQMPALTARRGYNLEADLGAALAPNVTEVRVLSRLDHEQTEGVEASV